MTIATPAPEGANPGELPAVAGECRVGRDRGGPSRAREETGRAPGVLAALLRATLLAICCLAAAVRVAAAEGSHDAAVATAHPLATGAAFEILEQGGNAFDAAVAAAAALAVVEPYSSGLGGGGFWLLHRVADARTVMLDGRERAPLDAHRDLYLDGDGNVIRGASVNGPLAAGIPGVPAALERLAHDYGRLPLARSLAPAIRLAREGFAVDARYRFLAGRRLEALKASPAAAGVFLQDGQVPEPGYRLVQPDLAVTLERIAEEGARGFYRGALAARLVEGVRRAGGIWRTEDLERYRTVEREPVRIRYRGAEIASAAPPSSGGLVLGIILNVLSHFDLAAMSEAARVHHIVEAMRRAYRDRAEYMGDPDHVRIPSFRLLSADYAAALAATIAPDRATPSAALPGDVAPRGADTTHYSIVDAEGNRVGATLSINYPFGSGFMVEGTGVLLNDEMDDFAAKPGVPNLYGLVGGDANAIAPGKRMLSSMSPTFVESGGRVAVLGTPGGSRIITMVLLGVLEFLDGANAERMVSAPRYHHQYLPDAITFEPGALAVSVQRQLQALGHELKPRTRTYGNMHVVIRDQRRRTLEAASDPRGVGHARVAPIPRRK